MPQINPINNLKNTSEVSDLAHSVDEPIYVTKNGYGDMVYQSLLTSEKQITEGKTHDARESLNNLSKYGL